MVPPEWDEELVQWAPLPPPEILQVLMSVSSAAGQLENGKRGRVGRLSSIRTRRGGPVMGPRAHELHYCREYYTVKKRMSHRWAEDSQSQWQS